MHNKKIDCLQHCKDVWLLCTGNWQVIDSDTDNETREMNISRNTNGYDSHVGKLATTPNFMSFVSYVENNHIKHKLFAV